MISTAGNNTILVAVVSEYNKKQDEVIMFM